MFSWTLSLCFLRSQRHTIDSDTSFLTVMFLCHKIPLFLVALAITLSP